MAEAYALLRLLQLASPALPVGGYSYSEGLETLVQRQTITTAEQVRQWLEHELTSGSIRLEAAVLVRGYRAAQGQHWDDLAAWNHWLSASRDSAELRQQSWQMGRALTRLLNDLHPELAEAIAACGTPCNYALAFALALAHSEVPLADGVLAYLHSWASNLVGAAVKLVPLGQTAGQQILLTLHPILAQTTQVCLTLDDADLAVSSWGQSLASMAHETLYSRLFRS